MCRIIVRWLDKEDIPGLTPNRKQFDPVEVLETGQDPGSRIGYPDYAIFDLPDCSVQGALFLLEPQYDPAGPTDPDTGKPTKIQKRSGFAMAWTRLSTPIKNDIIAAYEADLPYVAPGVTDEDLLNWFDQKV
jgi:hypothetical protein